MLTVAAEVTVLNAWQRSGASTGHEPLREWTLILTGADRMVYPPGRHAASQRCVIPIQAGPRVSSPSLIDYSVKRAGGMMGRSPSLTRLAMTETIVVAASLVPYLRRGIRTQFGFAAERLTVCLLELGENPADEYKRSLQTLNAAQDLYEQLKLMGDQPSSSIEVDVSSNALLVLEALECQYTSELTRLQEADIRLQQMRLPAANDTVSGEMRALKDLIAVVRRHARRQGADEPFPVPVQQARAHSRRRTLRLVSSRPRR